MTMKAVGCIRAAVPHDTLTTEHDLKPQQKTRRPRNQAASMIEQAGAICLRRSEEGELQVLLVASRRNGRWGLPKGHIDPGEISWMAAEREAFEEAGARGRITPTIFGAFEYSKDSSVNRYRVTVHIMETLFIEAAYPEKEIRPSRWFSLSDAVTAIGHDGLR
jgi:8-oxo-dGTP pyrophosphatase MutT (NUDIX family)